MQKIDRFWRRLITNGPSREQLFDSLRLGFNVPLLSVVFLEQFYGCPIQSIPILGIGRVYDADSNLWRIEFSAGGQIFSGFYSTKTREGFVCDTSKIEVWPGIGPVYRPLSDYQLKCLIKLAAIADNAKFENHILARIIRGIKGIEKRPGYDTKMTEEQPEEMVKKIIAVKNLFRNNFRRTKIDMLNVTSQLRQILD